LSGAADRSGGARNVKPILKAVQIHRDQSKQHQGKNRAGAYTERALHISTGDES
jgi:hypothetical protein